MGADPFFVPEILFPMIVYEYPVYYILLKYIYYKGNFCILQQKKNSVVAQRQTERLWGKNMTIEEFYEKLGGDYTKALNRLPGIQMIKKFSVKFLEDSSYENLCVQIACGNKMQAYYAAATLKEVCGNLAFGKLWTSMEKLTGLLKTQGEEIPEETFAVLEEVKKNYEETAAVIREFIAE